MVAKNFVEKSILDSQIDEFLREKLGRSGYSHSEIKRTPLGVRIIVYTAKPGLVIGRGGKRINETTKELGSKFGLKSPQLDIEEIENLELNAEIVANEVARAVEHGVNPKRVCNSMLRRSIEAGAAGAEMKVSGRIGGSSRGRVQKFGPVGYLKKSGELANRLSEEATAKAVTPASAIGIKVRITKSRPAEIEKLSCEICGKKFNLEEELAEHLKAHEAEIEE